MLRIQLAIPASGPPKVTSQTVIASGLPQRADKDVFLIGPTGLALIGGTLYVSDAIENRIVAIPDATTRTSSAGTGRTVTKDGLMERPLALAATGNGHILACNGKNGEVVEFDPASGKQLAAQWIDSNQAQSPPGNGDLFGLAMAPDGSGFYYVEDDTNMLAKATQQSDRCCDLIEAASGVRTLCVNVGTILTSALCAAALIAASVTASIGAARAEDLCDICADARLYGSADGTGARRLLWNDPGDVGADAGDGNASTRGPRATAS